MKQQRKLEKKLVLILAACLLSQVIPTFLQRLSPLLVDHLDRDRKMRKLVNMRIILIHQHPNSLRLSTSVILGKTFSHLSTQFHISIAYSTINPKIALIAAIFSHTNKVTILMIKVLH